MNEILFIFPTTYFVLLTIIFILVNFFKLEKTIRIYCVFLPYLVFSIFLGLRNIYTDPTLDPKIFYDQAKDLSVEEIFLSQFPKVDILIQLLMKFILSIFDNRELTLILTELVILSLFFLGTSLLLKWDPNALLLVISFLAFTNTGILLSANFLRQGLAASVFIFSIHVGTSLNWTPRKKYDYQNLSNFLFLQTLQFFSHISSVSLPLFLIASSYLKKKKLPQRLFFILLFGIPILLLGSNTGILSQADATTDIYQIYKNVDFDGGSDKIYLKLSIDAVAIILMLLVKRFVLKVPSPTFYQVIKICCLLSGVCLYYASSSVIAALRMEYYLNFLVIIALAALINSNDWESRISRLVIVSMSIACMYSYSFIVYSHPSVTRVLVF